MTDAEKVKALELQLTERQGLVEHNKRIADQAMKDREEAIAWKNLLTLELTTSERIRKEQERLNDELKAALREWADRFGCDARLKAYKLLSEDPAFREKRKCESTTGTDEQVHCVKEADHRGRHSDGNLIEWYP